MNFTGSFAVGPGWMDICRAAVERLENEGAMVTQVKEKFGGLRIYWQELNELPEDIGFLGRPKKGDIVSAAELVASWTCMQCGKVKSDVAVRYALNGWLVGYCQECLDKWNNELIEQGLVNRSGEN